MKKKQDEESAILTIFCSKCRKRHPLKECPLNTIRICGFCIENHQMENYPSFPELQAIFKEGNEDTSQRKPWNQEIQEDFKRNKTLCLIILILNLGILKHPSNHGLYQTYKNHGKDILVGMFPFINTLIL